MTTPFKPLLLAVLATALTTAARAAPDAKLLAAAQAAEPAVIQSLKDMVTIESGTMDAPGLGKMADYAQARLQALGLQVERRKASANHGDVLVGRLTGTGKRRLMLIAHLDTIYWPGTLASQPIKQDGNKLYGPGIADDKGGVAVILHTLAILKAAGWQDYAQLTVLLNGDEESGSGGSGETIATLADQHDVVLSYEPTAAKAFAKAEGVLLAAAGVATVTMEVKGRASHAGAAPQLGRNALVELAHQVLQTQDIAKGIPGAQLNWTTMSAGKTRNQIPDTATASADVRLTAAGASDQLLAALRAKVAEAQRVPDTEVSLRMGDGRPPFVGGERTLALAKRAQAIYAELDGRPLTLVPGTGGGTDAGFANRSGKAVVLESLGLAGWGYHAKDEYIEIDSIVPRLYLSTRLLMDLGKD
jgi:glutamate carboxypeptidase